MVNDTQKYSHLWKNILQLLFWFLLFFPPSLSLLHQLHHSICVTAYKRRRWFYLETSDEAKRFVRNCNQFAWSHCDDAMNGSSLTIFNAQRMPRKIFYHVNKWASNKNTSHRFYFDVRLYLEECRIAKSNVQHIQSVKSRQELWILLSAGKCVFIAFVYRIKKHLGHTE